MKTRVLFVVSILVLAAFAPVGAQEPASPAAPPYMLESDAERDRFLAAMPKALAEVRSLRADFAQTRRLAAFLDTLESRGVLCFEPPDKLRWEIVAPYETVMIYDGKSAAKFDRVEGRLRKTNMGGEDLMRELLGQISGWMRGRFEPASDLYRLELYKGEDYRLVMTPRSKDLFQAIEAVELSIDPASSEVTRVTIREPGDDRVEIRFVRREINPPLDSRLFDPVDPILLDAGKGKE